MHSLSWMSWLAVSVALLLTTRNPLVVLQLLLTTLLVWRVRGALSTVWLRLALSIMLFATLFNTLFVHVGESVFGRIPGTIPLLSGNLTWEAVAYGIINGLVLLSLLTLFLTFNQMVTPEQMLLYTPRALQPVALVVLIGLTYVPNTIAHAERVREAQAVRGHEVGGWRDWPPLLLPLLVGGLERSWQLAESMTARGFRTASTGRQARWLQLLLLCGLLCCMAGLFLPRGTILGTAGVLIMTVALFALGRLVPRTRFRPNRPTAQDVAMLVAFIVALAVVYLRRDGLYFNPYPRLSWPTIDVASHLSLLTLLLPLGARRA